VGATGAPAANTDLGEAALQHMRLEQVDQLHAAVLAASSNCFELKKLCATVVVPAMVLIQNFVKPAADRGDGFLDPIFFIAGGVIISFFWFADAVSYFYQAKIRKLMDAVAVEWQSEAGAIKPRHIAWEPGRRPPTWLNSLFNPSMYFYAALGFVDVAALTAWMVGAIRA
jgi:hypothetical protein